MTTRRGLGQLELQFVERYFTLDGRRAALFRSGDDPRLADSIGVR